MRVNLFTRTDRTLESLMLAVPDYKDETVPLKIHKSWQYLGTLDSSDATFRSIKVDEEIAAKGYCVFTP